jgi:uncharacterized membrane protein YedE/YeeE
MLNHWPSLVGGMLIGLSSATMLVMNGRVAGISGITGAMLTRWTADTHWKAAFLIGLVIGPAAFAAISGHWPPVTVLASFPVLLGAGVLVGFGTRLGSGCTSGHGVSGLARLSPRSFAAVGTFMATAAATVFVVRHLLSGWLP